MYRSLAEIENDVNEALNKARDAHCGLSATRELVQLLARIDRKLCALTDEGYTLYQP